MEGNDRRLTRVRNEWRAWNVLLWRPTKFWTFFDEYFIEKVFLTLSLSEKAQSRRPLATSASMLASEQSSKKKISANTFCQLAVSSTWHFVNQTIICHHLLFHLLDILSTKQYWLIILSTCRFIYLTFCQP